MLLSLIIEVVSDGAYQCVLYITSAGSVIDRDSRRTCHATDILIAPARKIIDTEYEFSPADQFVVRLAYSSIHIRITNVGRDSDALVRISPKSKYVVPASETVQWQVREAWCGLSKLATCMEKEHTMYQACYQSNIQPG